MHFKKHFTVKCLLASAILALNSLAIAAPVKVAFIGDQGVNSNSRAVLTLIANEDTDLLLIQGDLGYKPNSAAEWDANITNALGSDFPVLTVVGNHENFEWPLYKSLIQKRINRIPDLDCVGDTGVKALCQFSNIDVVQVAPGITEVAGVSDDDNYEQFIRSSFPPADFRWRICSWHKNQRDMQASDKSDSTGWGIYDACLDTGAMITMGHAHSYSRTHLLSNFEEKTIVHKSDDMTLKPGQSFAFVSGLGGRDVVPQQHSGDWFASIYTASQGATHGALFCTFETTSADCYFKAIDGAIPDRFTLTLDSISNEIAVQPAPPPPEESTLADGYVFARTDAEEFRWIDRDATGTLSSTSITDTCAAQLGGSKASGDWDKLTSLAPSFNPIDTPCIPKVVASTTQSVRDAGYVFSRTDRDEYRWIDRDANGHWGSVWINSTCAQELGGASESGDWDVLTDRAPSFDAVQSPCSIRSTDIAESNPGRFNDIGYVYSRTDKIEFRWIARNDKGVWGSIWINKACAYRLGGPKAHGDWFELIAEAPGFDSIPNPCS